MRSLVLAAYLVLGSQGTAEAHAFLARAEPAVGSTIAASPRILRIAFTEAVEIGFSGIELIDAGGKTVTVSNMRFADDTHEVLLIDVPVLSPGTYRVKWHVVSIDTHRTEGDYTFTVKG